MARREVPRIPDSLLDQLLAGADPKTAFDANSLLDDLKKALAERALDAEMDHHLASDEAGNSRNGYSCSSSSTSRIARLRISGENLFVVLRMVAPPSQELEPPPNPGRLTATPR